VLTIILGEGCDGEAVSGELTVLLPARQGMPAASPLLPGPREAHGETGAAPPALGPFDVDAVGLPANAALDLLLRLPQPGRPSGAGDGHPQVVVAPDLAVPERASRLVLDLVARGRVVPRLARDPDGDGYVAQWRPLRTDLGTVRAVGRLVEALPAVGRAALAAEDLDSAEAVAAEHGGWEAVPAPSATAVVWGLVDALTDACVREALAARGPRPAPPSRPGRARPDAADAWLAALTGADPRLSDRADPAAVRRLAEALDAWAAPGPEGEDAFRVGFRLHPPPEARPSDEDGDPAEGGGEAEDWTLELLLQSLEDPTLHIPAAEVWDPDSPGRAVVATRAPDPDAMLLAGLGRAVRCLSELEAGLRTARPEAVVLDSEGAARFLRHGARVLEQAGFGVFLPPFWEGGRLGLKLHVQEPGDDHAPGFGGWFRFRWEVALGDELVTADELARLAALKVPLLRVKGRWVELRPEDVDLALAALRDDGEDDRRMGLIDALRAGLGAAESPMGLPVRGVEADGPLGALLGGDGKLKRKRTPRAFEGKLRPYQERGLSWLSFLSGLGLGGCLADDMGLGKTIQLLALLLAERSRRRAGTKRRPGAGPGPTLLVCPTSVVGNWQREAARFAPSLLTLVHHGAGRLAGETFVEAAAGADLVVTTYGVVLRDAAALAEVDWHRVALDEAQNVKNPDTKIAQAVRALPAATRVALTGTPVENRLSDLWSIMEFLNPGLLGSRKAFREQYAVPIERYGSADRAAALRRLVRPFLLRRLKTDRGVVRDLPHKLELKVYCQRRTGSAPGAGAGGSARPGGPNASYRCSSRSGWAPGSPGAAATHAAAR